MNQPWGRPLDGGVRPRPNSHDLPFDLADVGALGFDTTSAIVATETPVSPLRAAPHLLDQRRLVFLDSSLAGGHTGRYSYLTANPFMVVRSRGRRVELVGPTATVTLDADPFDVVDLVLRHYRIAPVPGLPPFVGGAIGYIGYDAGRVLERQPVPAPDDEALPDLDIGFYDWVLAADHLTGQNWLIRTIVPTLDDRDDNARIHRIDDAWALAAPIPPDGTPAPRVLRSNVRRADYLDTVRQAKEYIAAGDIYQVNLSQRLGGPWSGPTWPLYERLRSGSPTSFGAYLALDSASILSASPERFVRLAPDGRHVESRPIKGTRPRGRTPDEDRAIAADLLSSEKDRAENLMIVDLLRNDLGKVCQIGSVRVPELFRLEPYSTVWQMVSAITGTLLPEMGAVDLLRACFPGGSVTGCPKIRAMQIIEELEAVRRGVYCGAIGYLSITGAMDTSIAIRTLVLSGGGVSLHVGGAIVADSDPEAEYAETITKARAGLEAVCAEVEEW